MEEKQRFSRDFRTRVAREAIESGNQSATAKKYKLSPGTLYSWVKNYRNLDIKTKIKKARDYESELADKDLEIQILRELLKKTTVALVPDSKSLKFLSGEALR